jgi:hypothetical protein
MTLKKVRPPTGGGARGSSTGKVDPETKPDLAKPQPVRGWALVEMRPRGRYHVLAEAETWQEAAWLFECGGRPPTWAILWRGPVDLFLGRARR